MNDYSIIIKDLKFAYSNQKNILDIPELKISKGEKVFIYGPSGFGKSTLLNLISGVLNFNEGEIQILGQSLKNLSKAKRDQLRGNQIGYIFQIFNLITYLNIKENIQLPIKINPKRMKNGNLEEHTNILMSKLKLTEIDRYNSRMVSELSIGQQQRVAQARALIGFPNLIIADEPTSSLDETNTSHFMETLINEWNDKKFTLIFVSHDERLKKYFDRTLYLPELNKANI